MGFLLPMPCFFLIFSASSPLIILHVVAINGSIIFDVISPIYFFSSRDFFYVAVNGIVFL